MDSNPLKKTANFLKAGLNKVGLLFGPKEKLNLSTIPVQPFDLILFKGDDPIGKMISAIELKNVSPEDRKANGALWTHVGVIVNKKVLPLDCMEDDKLYIYESILSGTVLGIYPYTKVMSVDHPLEDVNKQSYAGPQLRPFVETVTEAQGDIAVTRLNDETRALVFANGLEKVQETMLAVHEKYKVYGYPFTLFTQFAAASDCLYGIKTSLKSKLKSLKKDEEKVDNLGHPDEHHKNVFCSQFAAILYAAIKVPGFIHEEAGKYTPIELDAMACFEQVNYYIKKGTTLTLPADGKSVYANPVQ